MESNKEKLEAIVSKLKEKGLLYGSTSSVRPFNLEDLKLKIKELSEKLKARKQSEE